MNDKSERACREHNPKERKRDKRMRLKEQEGVAELNHGLGYSGREGKEQQAQKQRCWWEERVNEYFEVGNPGISARQSIFYMPGSIRLQQHPKSPTHRL